MNRAERRKLAYSKAKRKRDKDLSRVGFNPEFTGWYTNLHQYSKNKIHCSCPMCRMKTRDPAKKDLWPIHDRRQIDNMDYQEENENG